MKHDLKPAQAEAPAPHPEGRQVRGLAVKRAAVQTTAACSGISPDAEIEEIGGQISRPGRVRDLTGAFLRCRIKAFTFG